MRHKRVRVAASGPKRTEGEKPALGGEGLQAECEKAGLYSGRRTLGAGQDRDCRAGTPERGQKKDSDILTATGDRVPGDSVGSRDTEGKPTGFLR